MAVWLLYLGAILAISASQPSNLFRLDFRSFYAAGYLLRTDPSHLYDLGRQKEIQDARISHGDVAIPFFHPSYEALIYAPLSWLHYKTAYLTFQCLNLVLLLCLFLWSRDLFSSRIPPWQMHPGLLFFPFVPVLVAIYQGQNSILMLVIVCTTWKNLEKNKDAKAGALLALALFKFQIMLPIALLVALRRGRRFATGFVASAAIVTIASISLVGISGSMSLIHLLHAASLASDQGQAMQFVMAIHPAMMPNVNGVVYALGGRFLAARGAFWIVAAISSALFVYCAVAVLKQKLEASSFTLAILCGILVSSHFYIHDATLLLLPIALVGAEHLRTISALYILPAIFFFASLGNWTFLLALPIGLLLVLLNRSDGRSAAGGAETGIRAC